MSSDTPKTSFDIAMKHGNWNSLRDASAAWNELLDYTAEKERELAAVTAERDDLRENGQRLMEVADGWKAEAQRVTAERDALKKDLADAHGIAQACELRAERAEAECAALRKKHGN